MKKSFFETVHYSYLRIATSNFLSFNHLFCISAWAGGALAKSKRLFFDVLRCELKISRHLIKKRKTIFSKLWRLVKAK